MIKLPDRLDTEVYYQNSDRSHLLPVIGLLVRHDGRIIEMATSVEDPSIRIDLFQVSEVDANRKLSQFGIRNISLVEPKQG